MKLEFFSVKNTEKIIPKINKMLSETPIKPAEILNLSLSRSFSFLNLTLLGSSNKTLAEPFSN
jgi:hypothetical protein